MSHYQRLEIADYITIVSLTYLNIASDLNSGSNEMKTIQTI